MTSDFSASTANGAQFDPTPVALPPSSNPSTTVVAPQVDSPRLALTKVLHLINGEFYSGAERVQDLLALRLVDFGFAADFACLKPGRFPNSRHSTDALVHECHMQMRLDLRVMRQLCELISKHDYRLIHAHTPRSVMIGNLVAARCNLPLVYHVHSPTSRDSNRSLMNKINAVTERWSMSRVSRIVTVSESLARHIECLGFASDNITVVPNGVPTLHSAPRRRPPSSSWTLGTVALFRPRKGVEILLRAIKRLRDDGHLVCLRAVGGFETTDYERHLMKLTQSLGLEAHVEWLGFRSDVNAELAKLDLFVLPSLFGEGMPMVVLESMAMGVPVVGTRVEGVPEVIRDGIDGRIAQPNDDRDLASAIASLMEGDLDWSTMRENVMARHRDQFSDQSMARGVANVYEQVLEPTRAVGTQLVP